MIIVDGIINWIKDFKDAILITRMRRSTIDSFYSDRLMEQRALERIELWNQENSIQNSSENDEDPNQEYSNGTNGFKITNKVTSCRKTIGIFTRWELFYIVIKHEEETSYSNFIYMSTDGLSKHDWRVEIDGVDII